jgi:hypothetical protein
MRLPCSYVLKVSVCDIGDEFCLSLALTSARRAYGGFGCCLEFLFVATRDVHFRSVAFEGFGEDQT